MSSKPRVIKDFDKLDPEIQNQVKYSYPFGFTDHLIRFTNKDGKYVSALPFETDEKYYLIRMTAAVAEEIISEDDDFNNDGNLKEEVKDDFEDKYGDLEYIEPAKEVDSEDEEED